jgi:predicted Zn-dependent protease
MTLKYTPRELSENVNISSGSPLKFFLGLIGCLLGISFLIYIGLGIAVDFVVPQLPCEVEAKLKQIFSPKISAAPFPEKEKYLQQILDELVSLSSLPKLDYKVHLADTPIVNAVALPGGYIIIFSGLLKELESENELVMVLAHELGHFAARDHLRALGRALVLFTLSTLFFGPDSSISNFFQNSLLTVEFKFSQAQEQRADEWAVELLNKKYNHVAGAVDFFKRLQKKEKFPEFFAYFSTHPFPRKRVAYLKRFIQEKKYLLADKQPLSPILKN